MTIDDKYMLMAIEEAKIAENNGEVPIGAIIVKNGIVIGRGRNKKEENKNPISHAEIEAIYDACNFVGDWRLNGSVMYVTAEPCIMCAGAIIHARIDKVVFGVLEKKFGGIVSQASIFNIPTLNHKINFSHGIYKNEISDMMKSFFVKLRKKDMNINK